MPRSRDEEFSRRVRFASEEMHESACSHQPHLQSLSCSPSPMGTVTAPAIVGFDLDRPDRNLNLRRTSVPVWMTSGESKND